ncbi:MAG: glycosyltransferase family 61 protein [Actinobacteria bacterium]|nr:glycosyltransferase family 61 protein [Actinomycetota bacterium]
MRDRLALYAFLKRHTSVRRVVMQIADLLTHRSTSRSDLDRLTEIALSNAPVTTRVVRPAEVNLPITASSIQSHLRESFLRFATVPPRPLTLTNIDQGRALGIHGVPTTRDGAIITELAWGPHQLLAHPAADLIVAAEEGMRSRPKRLEGRAALLTTAFGRGYFHWLVDVLPRMEAFAAAGMAPADVDYVIVPTTMAPFQKESLLALGFEREQLVSSLRHRHLVAKELLVPSLVRPTGAMPKWACDFLRRAIAPTRPSSSPPPERLLITRKATDHGFSAFNAAISDWGRRNGFAQIALEDFSLAEKAWLLKRTQIVIGETGAGLTNIVFCQPGAALIEITRSEIADPTFWDLAYRCGLSYRSLSEAHYERGEQVEAALDTALKELDL